MSGIVPIVVAAVALIFVAVFVVLYLRHNRSGSEKKQSPASAKDRSTIIKSANKRLAQNPRDPDALTALAEAYYKDDDYEKAARHYGTLISLCAMHSELDEFDFTLKHALSMLKLKDYEEAYKGLIIAREMNSENFELNYNLGYLEYLRKNYEKASNLLSQSLRTHPDNAQATRYLGLSLFRDKRYAEAVKNLRKTIEYEPDNKDALYALGQCYHELGSNDNALKIFTHLRTDPRLGPNAALYAGTININSRSYENAILDLVIGLRHDGLKIETEKELKYRLAVAYINQNQIDRALGLLHEILQVDTSYKDTRDLVHKYQELSKNKLLQVYMVAPTSEFVTLCRRIASTYYSKGKAKLVDISIFKNEYIDIQAEVNTAKWEDVVLFRFVRSEGIVGELIVRELYMRCRDLKAGRGLCLTVGEYSKGAEQFVEARLVDLIDKQGLLKIFNNLPTPGVARRQAAPTKN